MLHACPLRVRAVGRHASALPRDRSALPEGRHPADRRPGRSQLVAGASHRGRDLGTPGTRAVPGTRGTTQGLCATGGGLCPQDQHLRHSHLQEEEAQDVPVQVERGIRRRGVASVRGGGQDAAVQAEDPGARGAEGRWQEDAEEQADQ